MGVTVTESPLSLTTVLRRLFELPTNKKLNGPEVGNQECRSPVGISVLSDSVISPRIPVSLPKQLST